MVRESGEASVLVVEATATAARSLRRRLPTEGGRVRTATDPQSAAAVVADEQVDCVVAGHDDGLDGLAVLERVRSVDPDVPVVLFPTAGGEATASAAVAAGVTDYVPRDAPADARGGVDDLVDSVAAFLDDERRPHSALGTARERRRHQRAALFELATDDAVTGGDFDAALSRITETAAEVLGVPRVNVWLFDDDGRTLRCVDGYDRRRDDHEAGVELDADRHPAYFEALAESRTLAAVDALEDPRTEGLADYLSANDVTALLDATLRSEGEVVGVVCHEHAGGPRRWTPDEVRFAGDVADLVHRALRNRDSAQRRERLDFRESLLTAQQAAFPGGVLVVDDAGEVVSYDEDFLDLWDVSAETLAGDCEPVLDEIEACLAEPAAHESLWKRSEGTERATLDLADGRVVEVYTAPVVGEGGREYGRLWQFRDVTERRERERDRERHRRAIEAAPIGITITGDDGDDNPLVYVNERFEELSGYDWPDIEGRDCRFLQGPDTDPEAVAELRRAIEAEASTTVELRNYRADGSEFWNRVTVAPVRSDDGTVEHYVGFQEDVTERKRRERELAESEARYESLTEDVMDTSDVGTVIFDAEGTVVWVNAAVERYFGVDREALVGCDGRELVDEHLRDVVVDAAAFARRVATGAGDDEFECHVSSGPDRDERWLRYRSQPIETGLYAGGRIVHYTDVTDRKRRDQQLEALDRVLRHNLHNEMNLVLGNAASIGELVDGTAAAMAETIVESGQRLLDLTSKQRRIVHLLSEAPDLTAVDLAAAVDESVADVVERHPDADVTVEPAPDGTPAVGAIPQLGEALTELIENGVVHGDGAVTVSVATDGGDVRLRVADAGPGIPPEERAILLGEGERGPLYHGNGMGLWLVNWIVTYSEGRVTYDETAAGAVVTVHLRSADGG